MIFEGIFSDVSVWIVNSIECCNYSFPTVYFYQRQTKFQKVCFAYHEVANDKPLKPEEFKAIHYWYKLKMGRKSKC